ncbi:unnamed protein product [Staurois parvus]|uniref:Uncharacterized protein n=1 Tax=Staurois parvus TaxID=386267 RepID=A0ABN9EV23_9NEOB|nr:unnamed protein product [Staurois parvus]
MYINGLIGAVPKWVTIYKRPPHSLPVRTPWEHAAQRSSACCVRRNTDHCTGPLCEVPIM